MDNDYYTTIQERRRWLKTIIKIYDTIGLTTKKSAEAIIKTEFETISYQMKHCITLTPPVIPA